MERPTIKSFVYEVKPFFLASIGIYAMAQHHSPMVGKLASLLLVGCAVSILYMRARYRGLLR